MAQHIQIQKYGTALTILVIAHLALVAVAGVTFTGVVTAPPNGAMGSIGVTTTMPLSNLSSVRETFYDAYKEFWSKNGGYSEPLWVLPVNSSLGNVIMVTLATGHTLQQNFSIRMSASVADVLDETARIGNLNLLKDKECALRAVVWSDNRWNVLWMQSRYFLPAKELSTVIPKEVFVGNTMNISHMKVCKRSVVIDLGGVTNTLSTIVIVFAVVGGLIGLLVIILIIWCCYKTRYQNYTKVEPTSPEKSVEEPPLNDAKARNNSDWAKMMKLHP